MLTYNKQPQWAADPRLCSCLRDNEQQPVFLCSSLLPSRVSASSCEPRSRASYRLNHQEDKFRCDTEEMCCSGLPGKAVNDAEQESWQISHLFLILLLFTDARWRFKTRSKIKTDGQLGRDKREGLRPSASFNGPQENLWKTSVFTFICSFKQRLKTLSKHGDQRNCRVKNGNSWN